MLVQLLAIPIITKNYGLPIFGEVALCSSIGLLLANLVNYGTTQTAVKEVSIFRNDKNKLSFIFSEIFFLRLTIFFILLFIFPVILLLTRHGKYLIWVSILPLLISEIFNPLYFLIGIEKIHWISLSNLFARALSLVFIFYIQLNNHQTIVLNLFLSTPQMVYSFLLFYYILRKYHIKFHISSFNSIKNKLIENFYVTFNGSTVIMQQTIFMFFVANFASPQSTGSYAIIDKFLGAVRQIVSSFSSAIYPKAAQLYHIGLFEWKMFRSKIQILYFLFFLFVGVFILTFAEHAQTYFSQDANSMTNIYLKLFSFAPLALALNANNILDLLLSKSYRDMFVISVIVLIFTIITSILIAKNINESYIGLYPLIIESACLIIYTTFLRFKRPHYFV